ncbi:uncharacterized protein ACR2FA_005973 [Aphomia sociella]
MYRLILLCLLASVSAAPAPKPVVVFSSGVPAVYHPPLVAPAPLVHAPVVHHAPVVSHVSTLYHQPVVPAYRPTVFAPHYF